jgi:hypothetical protein
MPLEEIAENEQRDQGSWFDFVVCVLWAGLGAWGGRGGVGVWWVGGEGEDGVVVGGWCVVVGVWWLVCGGWCVDARGGTEIWHVLCKRHSVLDA